MEVTASFKEQTEYLVDILLGEEEDDDDSFTGFRCLGKASESDEEKQAIKSLAHRLRETGDLIDREHLNSFSSEFQTLIAKHARDQACELFSSTVSRIFQNWSSGKELTVEENLLKISASLGLQTMKQVPSLIEEIRAALKIFIDTRLQSWVSKSNGWLLKSVAYLLHLYKQMLKLIEKRPRDLLTHPLKGCLLPPSQEKR